MAYNPKPHRLTPCHRHPNLPTTTGLCTPCLHQRLTLLSPSTSSSSTLPLPELRRCKTLSSTTKFGGGSGFEPRRRSCDVGGRNSLSSLFRLDNDDDDRNVESKILGLTCPVIGVREDGENPRACDLRSNRVVESGNLGITCPVAEIREEDDDYDDDDEIVRVSNLRRNRIVESGNLGITRAVTEIREEDDDDDDEDDEIVRVSNFRNHEAEFVDNRNGKPSNLRIRCPVNEITEEVDYGNNNSNEIVRVSNFGDGDKGECDFELEKSMKEFINLELAAKRKPNSSSSNNRSEFKRIAGSFLGAASVFNKKLRKWRKKHETSTRDSGRIPNGAGVNLEGRRLSYTQSEVGDYGRRRSCDKDIRGSIELGRASIDCGVFGRNSCDSDPRFSIDLGRASVDCGRMSVDGGKSGFSETPRMSLDGYLGGGGGGGRSMARRGGGPVVSVIENAMATIYGFDDRVFGEDENDSLVRRRKGLDRCSSIRRENGEAKTLSSAKASPASNGNFNGSTKMVNNEKGLNEWRMNSRKDDSSESFETASKDLGSVSSSSIGMGEKKCRQWSKLWSFWGSLHRRKGGKSGNLQDEPDIAARASTSGFSSRMGSRRRNDGVLERNPSGKDSPSKAENDGLLRFYLTPLRRNRLGKSRLKKSHSLARSVLM